MYSSSPTRTLRRLASCSRHALSALSSTTRTTLASASLVLGKGMALSSGTLAPQRHRSGASSPLSQGPMLCSSAWLEGWGRYSLEVLDEQPPRLMRAR